MIDERLKSKLLAMTWDGLREWSGPQSVTRGKEYERLVRNNEWQRILDGLRTEYKRRSSRVKILNDIDREKGGTGRIAD